MHYGLSDTSAVTKIGVKLKGQIRLDLHFLPSPGKNYLIVSYHKWYLSTHVSILKALFWTHSNSFSHLVK